mmetsp:Transcript_57151/g.123672  ORF Transcript_57151/g.123672 Transcript_57151/m.123672 type:complete len:80 (-) Transcript_57151:9-248(-)
MRSKHASSSSKVRFSLPLRVQLKVFDRYPSEQKSLHDAAQAPFASASNRSGAEENGAGACYHGKERPCVSEKELLSQVP